MIQLQRVWTLCQRLPPTKEDEKRTKISEIGGQGQEDILEGNEGEEGEAKRRSSVKPGLFFAA